MKDQKGIAVDVAVWSQSTKKWAWIEKYPNG